MKTIREFLSDQLSKTDLFEMAFDKKTIERKIDGLARPILLHLIKILKWDDKQNYNKHIKDINSWLREIDRLELKPKKKKLKSDIYYFWLYDGPIGNSIRIINSYIDGDLEDYHKLNIKRSNKEVMISIEKIIKQISIDISNNRLEKIQNYL